MYKYKMKYLFDKSKFTLDSNTNKYVLEFTENFNQPQQLTIHGFHYQVSQSTHPSVVLVRSNLFDIISSNEICEPTSNNLYNPTNVLCVLYETHTTGIARKKISHSR